jgi:hypothetical protein
VALKVIERGRERVELSATELVEISCEENIAIPGIRAEELGDQARGVGRLMAKCFNNVGEVQMAGVVVRRIESEWYDEARRENKEVRRYVFTRPGETDEGGM